MNKEYFKAYREANKEKLRLQNKAWREANKEKCKEYSDKKKDYHKQYYIDNKETIKKNQLERGKEYYQLKKEDVKQNRNIEKEKLYYQDNKDKIRERNRVYSKNRRANDVMYQLKMKVKNIIQNSFRRSNYSKTSRTYDILGCSYEEFKQHLESKFEPWMTWENRGLYNGELNHGWDIDHIIPLDSAKNEKDLVKLNHYTNLQPLCGYKNRYIKRNN